MQIKADKSASELEERKKAILDAVSLLNLAGELTYSNPGDALAMINDVRARGLKEVEYIADIMWEVADDWIKEMYADTARNNGTS